MVDTTYRTDRYTVPEPLRRTFLVFGICCLTLSFSLTGFLADGHGGLSLPFPVALFRRPAPAPTPTPEALALVAPVPSPLPSPIRRHSFLGDGPITLRGDGNVVLGFTHANSQDYTQDVSSLGSSMTFNVERRTERAAVSITDTVGYASSGTSLGTLQVGYTTPQYAFGYGPVAGPAETQLQIGGLAQGVSLAIPRPHGQVELMGAAAAQGDGTTYRVFGLRRDSFVRSGTLALSGFYGAAEGASGKEAIGDIVYHRYGAKISTIAEAALSMTRGVAGVDNGNRVAFAVQSDMTSRNGFTALSIREAPAGFATLTSFNAPSLDIDLSIRRELKNATSVSLDTAENDVRTSEGVSRTHRLTGTLTRTFRFGGASLLANVATNSIGGLSTINRSAALSLTQSPRGFSLTEAAQISSVSGASGNALQRELDIGIDRALLGGNASLVGSRNMTSGDGASGSVTSVGVRYSRAIGRKLDLTLAENNLTSNQGGIVTSQMSTSIGLLRRISSVVALHVSGTRTIQSGVGAGASNSISVDLVGPLSFGGARFTGRSNPNVPATIRGIISFAGSGTDLAFQGSSVARGVANALVVLDGRFSQRTDARGQFEFRFVPQGSHTVTLEPGTLSPGLIPDHEVESLKILGGQVVTLNYSVGSFAGIGGYLTIQKNGKEEPLGGVTLIVDKIQRVITATDGRYQVGRLTTGAHTIAIVDETVPSTVQFTKREQSVTVSQGAITKVDFSGTTLGSIAGSVLLASAPGSNDVNGAKNVYVLAQPGDHAAITNDDGSYVLDNLPPGKYTLQIDPETLPEGLTVVQQPEDALTLAGGQAIENTVFRLGVGEKSVVFTYGDGKKPPISVTVVPNAAPPGALVDVIARSPVKGLHTLFGESDVFGAFTLRPEPASEIFLGRFVVPALAKGTYAFTVSAHGASVTDGDGALSVDPAIKLLAVRMSPAHPVGGRTAHVTAKILAPVFEGDTLKFEDGYFVKLPKPARRVFNFDVRIWSNGLPYSGEIVTRTGTHIPLILR